MNIIKVSYAILSENFDNFWLKLVIYITGHLLKNIKGNIISAKIKYKYIVALFSLRILCILNN